MPSKQNSTPVTSVLLHDLSNMFPVNRGTPPQYNHSEHGTGALVSRL